MAKNTSSSFMPYALCSICNINHNTGVKHVYTASHQKKFHSLLKKSALKVKEAKSHLQDIEVHDEDWEKNIKFWCYFCELEVPKHRLHNTFMIGFLGFLHHFADPSHYEAVKSMLKRNRKNSENIEKYCVKKSELISFLDKILDAESKYIRKMAILNEKHILHIQKVEWDRKHLLANTSEGIQIGAQSQSLTTNHEFDINRKNDFRKVSDVSPSHSNNMKQRQYAVGVKKVPPWLQSSDVKKVPPWLQSNDVQPGSSKTKINDIVIGPSIVDLEKHVAHLKKKGLPAKRIGANFNHNSSTSSKWLPSYGRIWNQGRRKQSEMQYRLYKKKLKEEIK